MSRDTILIMCGCLEPGKDGVGDYVLRIGSWLEANGVEVAYLAMNDRYVERSDQSSKMRLRLSSVNSWESRFTKVQSFIETIEPSFIFLQFVPYAFHQKGVPGKFVRLLQELKTEASWIFMFHEAYIDGDLSSKQKLVRLYQKRVIKKLLRNSEDNQVFTSNKKYQKMLDRIGISSAILPLFGNVPFSDRPASKRGEGETKIGVYFGAPPKEETFDVFTTRLKEASKEHQLEVRFCGRPSPKLEKFISYLKINCQMVRIVELGEMESDDLSLEFFGADFGISRIAPELIGKSGASTAMLEHGLKLWIPLARSNKHIESEVIFRPELCYSDFEDLMRDRSVHAPESNIDNTGKILLDRIQND